MKLCIGGPLDRQWREWSAKIKREAALGDFKGNFKWHYYYAVEVRTGGKSSFIYRHSSLSDDDVLNELLNRYE